MARVRQRMAHGAIYFRVGAPAFFVRRAAAVSHARNHQTVFDLCNPILVACQPGDRADGSWGK
jgi:hypothetical protein